MGLLKTAVAVCPSNLHCAEWARIYMAYCLCSVKDGVSLGLGLASVLSWGVAEIPQIVTNYKEKSTEGLSIAFLTTWVIGDLFNVFGCLLEPATLPTQYYMAMLYTVCTVILTAQTIYYCHIYPRLQRNRRQHKGLKPSQSEDAEKTRKNVTDVGKQVNGSGKWAIGSNTSGSISRPIPLPAYPENSSPGKELYYTSARSLSRSHTPTVGPCLAQRTSPPSHHTRIAIEEPLLGRHVPMRSEISTNTKTMLCLVPIMIFFTTYNLHHLNLEHNTMFEKPTKGFVMQVRRNLFQVNGGLMSQEEGIGGSSAIGSYLGWGMAAIYMGGRLPQILLNMRRGHVEGLNPLMFVFALVGNVTYVSSILVNSVDWSRIRPNLPWLVDAAGCVLLDCFILIQFIYFSYRSSVDDICENSNSA